MTYAICEIVGPHLYETGQLRPGDRAALRERVLEMAKLIPSAGDWLSALSAAGLVSHR